MTECTALQDCVIVGGGPAGLTAALYLARFLRSVTVIDAGDGRARMIPRTHNLGPFPDGISGPDLLDRMRNHAQRYGATVEQGTVDAVERHGPLFRVTAGPRIVLARSIIFACGVFNHRPAMSTEDHDRGVARGLIRYCPVCDAHEVRGKIIAVLGCGAHGRAEARFLCSYSASVTLIPPDGFSEAPANADDDGVSTLPSPMRALALTQSQVVIGLENGESMHFDTLYVALGTRVRTGLAAGLDVPLDENGHIIVDARQRTCVEGIYAAGDLVQGLDQIAVATGHGAIAATAVHNDLTQVHFSVR